MHVLEMEFDLSEFKRGEGLSELATTREVAEVIVAKSKQREIYAVDMQTMDVIAHLVCMDTDDTIDLIKKITTTFAGAHRVIGDPSPMSSSWEPTTELIHDFGALCDWLTEFFVERAHRLRGATAPWATLHRLLVEEIPPGKVIPGTCLIRGGLYHPSLFALRMRV